MQVRGELRSARNCALQARVPDGVKVQLVGANGTASLACGRGAPWEWRVALPPGTSLTFTSLNVRGAVAQPCDDHQCAWHELSLHFLHDFIRLFLVVVV